MKIITWITIVLVACVVGLLSYCDYRENPKSYFKNYEEAKASGLMERGWIPPYIPKSSTEIKEIHELDGSRVRMTFNYSHGDTKDVEENCTTEEKNKEISRYKCRYFESIVHIELNSNGTGKLESEPDY